MSRLNRVLIQSSTMTMRKEKDDSNYRLLVDFPEDANIVIHDFNPLDDEFAQVRLSVAEVVDNYDPDEETEEDD